MKKTLYILLALLSFSAIPASSQVVNSTYTVVSKEAKNNKIRQQIGLDYSMPDFETSVIDSTVIGVRLAKILDSLKKSYKQSSCNRMLATIRREQVDDKRIRYLEIDKIEIDSISKKDSVISICITLLSITEKKERVHSEIQLTFVNGVSENQSVNNLFCELCRYMRKEDDLRKPF